MNLRSTIQSLLRKTTARKVTSQNHKRSIRHALFMETLEVRTVFSTVNMLPIGGGLFNLQIVGDAKDNQIVVTDLGKPTSGLGDSIDISIDHQHWLVANVVNIEIASGGGDDRLLLTGVFDALTGIQANSGNGDDSVSFDQFSIAERSPGPHIFVDTGRDDDLVMFRPIFNPPYEARNDIGILTGPGDDRVFLKDFQFDSTIAGTVRLAIDTGSGDDLVAATNWALSDPKVRVGKTDLSITTAAGDDQVLFDDNDFQNLNLNVDTGADDDLVAIQCDAIGGPSVLSVSLGSGDDTLVSNESTFDGALNLTVNADSGDDFVAFFCNAVHGAASLSVTLGAGDDTLDLNESTFDGALNLAVNAGSGDDFVALLCDGMHDAASLSIVLGAGDDTLAMQENSFGGKQELTVSGDAGNDLVAILCDLIGGPALMAFSLGSGDDALLLEENTFDGALNLTVDAGSGADFVALLCNGMQDAAIISLALGAGDDSLAVLENSFVGPLKLTASGGAGNDTVTILCNGYSGANPFEINLGSGNNRAFVQKKSYDSQLDYMSEAEQSSSQSAVERVSIFERRLSNSIREADDRAAAILHFLGS